MNYWLWLEDRQERVRAATAVGDHPRPRRRSFPRLPRLLAVRTVPPGRPDAMQSLPVADLCSGAPAPH